MLLYQSPDFEKHQTGSHPESTLRARRINQMLQREGWLSSSTQPNWSPASDAQILAVHTQRYLLELEDWCQNGGGQIESDTFVSERSLEVAKLAAGATCDAVERLILGEDRRAFCAIRPPGHHALPNSAMGFCLLGNISIAARHAIRQGLNRVLIVDWDVHHGNGTQAVFWDDPQVLFLSIHRSPFYPGTGKADETGGTNALNTTRNIPVDRSIPAKTFIDRCCDAAEELANQYAPELILISAGFDAHVNDPVGGLTLESEDYKTITQQLCQIAETHCQGRVLSVLEGGYHLDHLPESVNAHLQGLSTNLN